MSDWKIIIPEATTNMVLNPSAETTGNFFAVSGATMTRSSTFNRYGLYSYRIQTAANNEGGRLTLSALANAIHYATLRVRGTLPPSWDWALDNFTYSAPSLIETIDANWSLYGLQFPAAQAVGSTTLHVRQNGAGAGDFYIDGAQVEQKEYWTTYADGDQQGCGWNGAEHASTSSRSEQSRAGGRVRDLQTFYDFDVGGMFGLGTAPRSVIMDEYALLPGGELNAVKVHPRPFSLTGVTRGTSYADLHTKLDTLEGVLAHNTYPQDENGWQPVRLRYTGAVAQKEVAAHYEGGLEGNIEATGACYWQRSPIRFLAGDPNLYLPGGSGLGGAGQAIILDTNDAITSRGTIARLTSTGQWNDLGITSNASTFRILIASDNSVYICGNFLNFNGVGGRDRIARYMPETGAWETVGGLSDFNNTILTLAEGPDGTIYAGGRFTNCAGDPNADYIAQWDGSNWTAVGQPVQGAAAITEVYAIAIGLDGTLYVGGTFLNWANIANADNVVSWTGAAYAAMGTGTNGTLYDIAVDLNGDIFIAGSFLLAGGVADTAYIARWDGSVWNAMSTGANGTARALAVGADGKVYIGGGFTTLGGVSVTRIGFWNGTTFEALGSGADSTIHTCALAPNGDLYVTGAFTTIGGLDVNNFAIARWNGASWTHLDADMSAYALVQHVALGRASAVISDNFDIYVAQATGSLAGNMAGLVTITNEGTTLTYPIITIRRDGGTQAIIKQIRNETVGKALSFDYSLLDGESLTIDLRPTRKSIISSMFGSRPDAILANSDFGDFTLQPGDNDVTCFVDSG